MQPAASGVPSPGHSIALAGQRLPDDTENDSTSGLPGHVTTAKYVGFCVSGSTLCELVESEARLGPAGGKANQ